MGSVGDAACTRVGLLHGGERAEGLVCKTCISSYFFRLDLGLVVVPCPPSITAVN